MHNQTETRNHSERVYCGPHPLSARRAQTFQAQGAGRQGANQQSHFKFGTVLKWIGIGAGLTLLALVIVAYEIFLGVLIAAAVLGLLSLFGDCC